MERGATGPGNSNKLDQQLFVWTSKTARATRVPEVVHGARAGRAKAKEYEKQERGGSIRNKYYI